MIWILMTLGSFLRFWFAVLPICRTLGYAATLQRGNCMPTVTTISVACAEIHKPQYNMLTQVKNANIVKFIIYYHYVEKHTFILVNVKGEVTEDNIYLSPLATLTEEEMYYKVEIQYDNIESTHIIYVDPRNKWIRTTPGKEIEGLNIIRSARTWAAIFFQPFVFIPILMTMQWCKQFQNIELYTGTINENSVGKYLKKYDSIENILPCEEYRYRLIFKLLLNACRILSGIMEHSQGKDYATEMRANTILVYHTSNVKRAIVYKKLP